MIHVTHCRAYPILIDTWIGARAEFVGRARRDKGRRLAGPPGREAKKSEVLQTDYDDKRDWGMLVFAWMQMQRLVRQRA